MDEAYDIILKITADGQRRFSMRLTQEAIMELERNPYVIRSGPDRITYSREIISEERRVGKECQNWCKSQMTQNK